MFFPVMVEGYIILRVLFIFLDLSRRRRAGKIADKGYAGSDLEIEEYA